MKGHWTFGQRIGAGFAVTIVLATITGIIAVYALRNAISSKDRVIATDAQRLIDVRELQIQVEKKSAESRAFLLGRDERFLLGMRTARSQFQQVLERLRGEANADVRRLLDGIARAEEEHQRTLEQGIALRRTDSAIDAVIKTFDEQVMPARDQLDNNLRGFVQMEEQQLRTAMQASTDAANTAMTVVVGITVLLIAAAIVIATVLTRTLGRQIGTAVGHVQSSSSELQAAANQQATSSREQSTAMSEISTTISELLATSRQITESAQRVAQIATDTVRAANAGESTVEQTQESIASIRRQVDLIVHHMLELGRKSQHIGAVLDIVSELAEQTNILAINATIEAAGAGEAGRRFAIVADEIRKLADRVTGSTKEIRGLIDDVRSAVNTTVMATETGSKTVDAGTKQFDHVALSFKQIAGQVATTTEAAREIELSTKQQMSAVEQVNVAIANIAQASKETEASSSQTLQTASQLATLSKDLLRLVRPEVAA
jgi:methyl-accepting chemotaxis protein/cell division protein FtsL